MTEQWEPGTPIPEVSYDEIDKAIEKSYEKNCWWQCGYLLLISGIIGAIVFISVIYDDLVMIHG